jgi:hypothetical protein
LAADRGAPATHITTFRSLLVSQDSHPVFGDPFPQWHLPVATLRGKSPGVAPGSFRKAGSIAWVKVTDILLPL